MKTLTRAFAFLLFCASIAFGQSFSGTVTGLVTDEQGGALPGATVTLSGKAGARTAVTDAKGEYRFTAVDPGSYDITVELTGFRPMKRADVPVSIGKTAEGLFTLKVGGLTESVDGQQPVAGRPVQLPDPVRQRRDRAAQQPARHQQPVGIRW
jgi:hypothetical protein